MADFLTDLLINQEVHFRSEGASETVQRNLMYESSFLCRGTNPHTFLAHANSLLSFVSTIPVDYTADNHV